MKPVKRRRVLTAPLNILFEPEDLSALRSEAARFGYPTSEYLRECIQAGRPLLRDRLRKQRSEKRKMADRGNGTDVA